jgi:hypothetical protein
VIAIRAQRTADDEGYTSECTISLAIEGADVVLGERDGEPRCFEGIAAPGRTPLAS